MWSSTSAEPTLLNIMAFVLDQFFCSSQWPVCSFIIRLNPPHHPSLEMIFLPPHWESCGWMVTLPGLSPHTYTYICNHPSFPFQLQHLYHPWFMSHFFLMSYSCLLHAGPHSVFSKRKDSMPWILQILVSANQSFLILALIIFKLSFSSVYCCSHLRLEWNQWRESFKLGKSGYMYQFPSSWASM